MKNDPFSPWQMYFKFGFNDMTETQFCARILIDLETVTSVEEYVGNRFIVDKGTELCVIKTTYETHVIEAPFDEIWNDLEKCRKLQEQSSITFIKN